MKKNIFGLIATVSISNFSFGQAVLEHSYTSNYKFKELPNAFKTETGLNYYTVEGRNLMKIYNSSHNLINTLIIPMDTNQVLNGIIGASDKLFNTDATIEFLVFTYNTIDYSYKLVLIDQNGTVLQNFGERTDAYIIKGISGDYKLVTVKFNNPASGDNSIYDIYSLPGTTLGTVLANRESNLFVGYPNPTENNITITNNLETGKNGILEIFDLNGKKVIQKNVIGEENREINLDVTELTSGVYIYKFNGQTNRFIKK
ncbi:T9SS type A sorting domain-containing protein [Flavobacterium oreochromis]|uniref:T9SS type A sorting domain-containing protein n=1 Tax=Flavobacterium oreochromis TaxID=2906078 RepID=UPI003859C288